MKTATITLEQEVDAPDQWPPIAHLIWPRDEPAKEGTIALCGAKLMGVDLGRLRNAPPGKICDKCVEVYKNRKSNNDI